MADTEVRTMKGKTLLKGHALRHEGSVAGTMGLHGGLGQAFCQCGMRSPLLPNNNQRQKWHREHKDFLRKP